MTSLRERLRAALKPAMKAHGLGAVSALRSALAAIDNAPHQGVQRRCFATTLACDIERKGFSS
ncbi:hypothetical protein [Nocardia salmonicida]|uniref:hypothetical protein n=1 Tax=Nocardia salmonicida TaxID=53431 RepID=UPI00379ADEE4